MNPDNENDHPSCEKEGREVLPCLPAPTCNVAAFRLSLSFELMMDGKPVCSWEHSQKKKKRNKTAAKNSCNGSFGDVRKMRVRARVVLKGEGARTEKM
jgi:hypothetical protein